MSQAVMRLLSEHNGTGIAGFVCHSEYHQLQKKFREELMLLLKGYQGRKL